MKVSCRFLQMCLLVLLCLILRSSAGADIFDQQDNIIKFQKSYLWNGLNDFIPGDNLVYAVYVSGLEIYRPLEGFLGQDTLAHLPLTHSYQSGFKLNNEILLYDTAGYLGFVYVKNPSSPRVISEVDLQTDFVDIVYKKLNVYLACGYYGVKIYDFGDRSNPALITTLVEPAHVTAVEIYNDVLYAIDDYNGIFIYDLSADPANPEYIGRQLYSKQVKDMTISGQTAWCANTEGGVVELDLSNPLAPVQVKIYNTQTRTDRVYILGGYIFGNDAYGNYEIFHPDSSGQTAYLVRRNLVTAPAGYSDRSGEFFCAVDSGGVGHVYRITDGWKLQEVNSFGEGSGWSDISLNEDYLYTTSQSDFLAINAIKQNFGLSDGVQYPARADAVYIYRGMLYIADNDNGEIWITDISNPSAPVFRDRHYYQGEVFDLAVVDVPGNRLAVVLFTSEQALIYYLDDSDYSLLATAQISARVNIFAGLVDIGYVYLFDADLAGHIYYIQDMLTGPAYFDDFTLNDTIVRAESAFGRIYTAGVKTLAVYDFGQGIPVYSGSQFELEGGFTSVKKHFLKVLASAGEDGLYVFDNSQETNLDLLAHVQTPGYAAAVEALDSLVIVSDKNNISLFELNDEGNFYDPHSPVIPSKFRIYQNYPNPFNQSTIIYLDIPAGSGEIDISLAIYNTLGQRVRTLTDSPLMPGRHRFEWDGRDDDGREAASGIYFYRCQGAGIESSRKMLLVK